MWKVDSIAEPDEDGKRRRFCGKVATPDPKKMRFRLKEAMAQARWFRSVSALAALGWLEEGLRQSTLSA